MFFDFHISIESDHDLKTVSLVLNDNGTEFETYKYPESKGYYIIFQSDYGEHELIETLHEALGYKRFDFLGIGKADIRVHLRRTKSPMSSDNWGRRINTDPIDENVYFGIWEKANLFDAKLRPVITKDFQAFIGVSHLKDLKTKENGFKAFIFPKRTQIKIDFSHVDFLGDQLFKTEEEALIEGVKLGEIFLKKEAQKADRKE